MKAVYPEPFALKPENGVLKDNDHMDSGEPSSFAI